MKIRTATITRLRDTLLQSGRRPSPVVSPAFETLARQGLLSAEEQAALSRIEPLAETMFLMMAADGQLSEAERDAVRGAVRGLTENALRSGTIAVMLENFAERLKSQGRDARLEEIARDLGGEPSDAESAFAMAAAVALADDAVATEENELLSQLAVWLELSDERVQAILAELEEDKQAEA